MLEGGIKTFAQVSLSAPQVDRAVNSESRGPGFEPSSIQIFFCPRVQVVGVKTPEPSLRV